MMDETKEVVKVRIVKLTEAECLYALNIMREVQNVTQQLAGELSESNSSGAILMLRNCSHVIDKLDELMASAVRDRLVEELWQRINPERDL